MRAVARCGATACLILSACAGFVSPPGPVVADRPGYTDTPTALPSGAVQLEAGITNDQVATSEYTAVGEALLRIGVGANTEVRLFGNSYAQSSASGVAGKHGMEDPKIGFKTNLLSFPDSLHSAVPNLAVLVATTLPYGATGFGASSAQPEVKLAANWTTPSPLSLYANAGVAAADNGAGPTRHGWVSAALWYAVNSRVSLFAEDISVRALSGTGFPAVNDADAGLTYLIGERFQLDVRVGHGFGTSLEGNRFLGAGLARRW